MFKCKNCLQAESLSTKTACRQILFFKYQILKSTIFWWTDFLTIKPACRQNLYEVKNYWQPKFFSVDNFKTNKIVISRHSMRKSGQKLPARMKYIWTCLATCSQVAAISAYLLGTIFFYYKR